MNNIEGTRSKLNPVACERAVNLILRAKRIYILGFSTSAYFGSIMAHLLATCCIAPRICCAMRPT